jgi:hypothetical protein
VPLLWDRITGLGGMSDAPAAFEDIPATAKVLISRSLRFAVYLTFLSVILPGVGAVDAALDLG